MLVDSSPLGWSLLSVWLLAALALAGCTGGDGGDGDEVDTSQEDGPGPANFVEGIGPDFVVLKQPIDATDCRYLELMVPVTQGHAEGLVPDPFTPKPHPVTGDDAAIVMEVLSCADAEHEPAGGYARAWVGVLVERPVLPEPAEEYERDNRTDRSKADEAVDVYVLAGYTRSQEFHRFLRQSGIPHEDAWIDIELDDVAQASVAQVEVEDREQGVTALQFVGGAASDEESVEHRAWWATTRRGVQLFEEQRTMGNNESVQYHAGTAACLVSDEGLFAGLFPAAGCDPATLRLATGLDVEGHSLWFHDTLVLE